MILEVRLLHRETLSLRAMISNEQFLSIILMALYLLLVWEIFENFSARVHTTEGLTQTAKKDANGLRPVNGSVNNVTYCLYMCAYKIDNNEKLQL